MIVLKHLKIDASGNACLPDVRQYKKVMEGENDAIKEIGDFYGLFSDVDSSWLTVEIPIKVKSNTRGV